MMLNGVDGTPPSAAGIGRVSLKVYHTTSRSGSRVTRTIATAAGPRISPAKTPTTISRLKSTGGAAPPAGSSCRRHKARHSASSFIRQEGRGFFHHFDLYAQAIAKIERGHSQDVDDVQEMLSRGLIDRAKGLEYFAAVEFLLYRYPSLDPRA